MLANPASEGGKGVRGSLEGFVHPADICRDDGEGEGDMRRRSNSR